VIREVIDRVLSIMNLLLSTHKDLRIDYVALKTCTLIAEEGLKGSGLKDDDILELNKIAEMVSKKALVKPAHK